MFVSAILLAAGKGVRLGLKTSKPLIDIMGHPAIVYSLRCLSKSRLVDEIIIVVNKDNQEVLKRLVDRYRIDKVKAFVKGGLRRQDSVLKGLAALDERCDIVLIHDSARPFIESRMIDESVKNAARSGAAVVAVPVKATIKQVKRSDKGLLVKKTLDRDRIWEVQTPQAFRKDILMSAYKRHAAMSVTDDSSLVEKTKKAVSIIKGSYSNIKITTVEDLYLANAIQEQKCRR